MAQFVDDLAFLSNFAKTDVTDEMNLVYRSVEAYYQASKSTDRATRVLISRMSPGAAKRAARTIVRRPDWEMVKLGVMMRGLRQKFRHGDRHGHSEALIATDPSMLVENNTWHDTYWGVCDCKTHKGMGMNWLGILLALRQSELLMKSHTYGQPPMYDNVIPSVFEVPSI